MKLPPFKLEEFFAKYEFTAPYLLCPSDVESWSLSEILQYADAECKKLWENLRLGYTEVPGLPLLRKEIAKLYAKIDHNQILTTAGAEEGIYCTFNALLSPNDHVIVVTPCYQSLIAIPKSLGADVTTITLKAANSWKISLEQLKKSFKANTKMVIINNPQNPTGSLLDKDIMEAMIEMARKRNSYIFCDEVYRYLEIDENKRLQSCVDMYEKGITINVMTKSFGLGGLRIGWIACQDKEVIKKITSHKLYTSICNSSPSEILALIALRAKDTILARNRAIIRYNLQILNEFFYKYRDIFSWIPPEAGTIAFPKLLLSTPIDSFTDNLVKETGVLIMPGTVFDYPGNHFRIGFGRKNMIDSLKRFEQFICKKI